MASKLGVKGGFGTQAEAPSPEDRTKVMACELGGKVAESVNAPTLLILQFKLGIVANVSPALVVGKDDDNVRSHFCIAISEV